jgi:PAS domain S-box-containing protein
MTLPIYEHERITALHAVELLDAEPEPAFQELVRLAAQVFQVPIALISLVDRDRLWFQARVGIDVEQTSRDASFCTWAILGTDILVVPDASADSRFATHPLVTSSLSVRFYAGAPLVTPDGYALGTLCLMDRVPRTLTQEQRSSLRLLANQVIERIVLRHRMRKAERSEERMRLLLDTALAAIISFDARNRVTEWNQQAEAMFGWKREEALAIPFDNLILPLAERELFRHAISSYGETGEGPMLNRPLQWTALHRDGHEIPIEIGIVPLKTRDGHAFNASIRDITQHKQAEEALRRSQTKLAKAQRLGHIGSWERDVRTNEVICSDEVYQVFGSDSTRPPLTYEELLTAYHPEDRLVLASSVRNAMLHHQPWNLELRIIRPTDGSLRYVHVLGKPLLDESGQVASIVGIMMDITDRKRTEDVLAQQAAELAAMLAKAEQVSRYKSEFLSRMSHEIRTPLNGVIGMTDLLVATELSPLQRELAETALNASESLLVIINDILDISKIEAGKLDICSAPFDLQKVVEETAEMLAVSAQKKNLALIVGYAPGVPRHLIGDAGRIRQILVNLVGNAVKFTPHGWVLLEVECLHATLDTAQIRVSVQDTGIGISPENLLRIFEDFAQAEVSTTRQYGGTGLGLAISRQLATLMNATLEADSVLGEGSTFCLTLTLPIDPNVGRAPKLMVEAPPSSWPTTLVDPARLASQEVSSAPTSGILHDSL